MTEKNWALGESGTKVVEVSHEAAHVASAASNLLVEREDLLWITGDAPQHVTLKLTSPHPPLRYVGWHVWHDYLTNPKTVEVASGESTEDMVAQLMCQAMSGAGTQIWKLPNPIPTNHLFIRIKILETFGPGPTYMNNVVLFANDPGTRFRSTRNTGSNVVKTKEGSQGRMSSLLKELDGDIRALHPIKTVTPKKNMLLYVPQEPMAIIPHEEEIEEEETPSPPLRGPSQRQGSNGMNNTPQYGTRNGFFENGINGPGSSSDLTRSFNDRLCALEQAVASLTQTMNHQREDLTMIKRLLLQQASERRRELERKITETHASLEQQQIPQQQQQLQKNSHRVSRHQVSVDFPEDALRSFVESVVTPKLMKHTKKTESQTIAKLDEFLKDIITEMTHAVDDRVKFHLQQVSVNGNNNFAGLPPYSGENRKKDLTHTPPQSSKNYQRSRYIDHQQNYHQQQQQQQTNFTNTSNINSNLAVPNRSSASLVTPPLSSVCSPHGKDVSNVPVSIIRDISTEAEPSFFRHARATSS